MRYKREGGWSLCFVREGGGAVVCCVVLWQGCHLNVMEFLMLSCVGDGRVCVAVSRAVMLVCGVCVESHLSDWCYGEGGIVWWWWCVSCVVLL